MTTLSELLHTAIRADHGRNEHSAFMQSIQSGGVAAEGVAGLLARLYPVYRELERSLDARTGEPLLQAFRFPELRRVPSLEQDLAFWYGDQWQLRLGASAAVDCYVDRLRRIGEGDGLRLIAHLYTRYLGDLSGGQILQSHLCRLFDRQPQDAGVSFWWFESLPTPAEKLATKVRFRDALDALSLSESDLDAIIDEARLAFALNRGLLEELQPAVTATPTVEEVRG